MFSKILVKTFIRDSENVQNTDVRNKYGYVAGVVGILSNLLLFVIKVFIGMLTSSIAIMADAFNNLSDMASSAITMIGFKLASKPADKEHPFGHGRIEYLSALIVAFMVMLVGLQFVKSSIERIVNPIPVKFEVIPLILLIASIMIKIWLSRFNKFMGNKIDSSALKAVSLDALGDVFTSSCVAISFLAAKFTSIPIDGYMGMGVALFIVYSGFNLVKETLNPLLGEAPDPELVNAINEKVMSYDNILGTHDLIIHNYGPGRCMCSIHAEIPSDISLVKIHEIIDKAERDISNELNIYLVIHIDPICIIEGEVKEIYDYIQDYLNNFEYVDSIHDFRVIGEGEYKNIIFDVVIDTSKKISLSDGEIKNNINDHVQKVHPDYRTLITVDKHYT